MATNGNSTKEKKKAMVERAAGPVYIQVPLGKTYGVAVEKDPQINKEQASYLEETPILCQNCRYFKNGGCYKVVGKIDPEGFCRLWDSVEEKHKEDEEKSKDE